MKIGRKSLLPIETNLYRIYIDSRHGLEGEFRRLEILEEQKRTKIWGYKNETERNRELIQLLEKSDYKTFELFCEALKESNQSYIVTNHLSLVRDLSRQPLEETDSAATTDPLTIRGLSKESKECIRKNWNKLIENITFDESFVCHIWGRFGILNSLQRKELEEIEIQNERTQYILRLLERGNEKQFRDFCSALRDSNQRHVVCEYLTPTTNGDPSGTTDISDPGRRLTVSIEPMRRAPDGEDSVQTHSQSQGMKSRIIEFSPCCSDFRRMIAEKVKSEDVYGCDGRPRGRALIISNEYFRNLSRREGTAKDAEDLKHLLSRLHFDCIVHENKSAEEIWKILELEKQDIYHLYHDMFVLFIMSHGICGEIYGLDGKTVKTKAILELFDGNNCKSLIGKPKLFFIQACQGDLKSTGVSPYQNDANTNDSPPDIVTCFVNNPQILENLNRLDDVELSLPLRPLPVYQSDAAPGMIHEMADRALFYATVEGHVAWRRKDTGSLFVQHLIEVIKQKAHEEDLLTMMTKVLKRLNDEDVATNDRHYKQIGETRATLRKKVYLLP